VDKGEHVTSVFTVLEEEAEENGAPPDGGEQGGETPTAEEGSDDRQG
jgi:hypothetical protein